MSSDGQSVKCRRNIAENFNRLSRVHERYRRQTDRRQTEGIASSRSLIKRLYYFCVCDVYFYAVTDVCVRFLANVNSLYLGNGAR